MTSGWRWVWCNLFHRKYRKRTGTRRLRESLAFYDVKFWKCGVKDVTMEILWKP